VQTLCIAKPLFKAYPQHQAFLFPPSLDSKIAANHPVRVVNDVIDKLDIDIILRKYKGGGTTSYHPRMLLKVLVYGYLNNIYSSCRIAGKNEIISLILLPLINWNITLLKTSIVARLVIP
jgi:hypothetical protein